MGFLLSYEMASVPYKHVWFKLVQGPHGSRASHLLIMLKKVVIDKSGELALTLFCVGGMSRTVNEWLVGLVLYLPGEG